ncbi:MAG: sulfotransferase, partial [Patulibacter sp.]
YMDATTVEECWRLLRQTGKSNSYESLAQVPRYTEWLAKQDWTDAYARHKQNLQLVGLNDPEKRWVLKNPSHMTALDALMTVYPDALIVYTHRDPVVCIASSCSLSAETTTGHSTTYVDDVVGRTQLDLWSRSFHAFHDARPSYPSDQFADVAFADLRADPLGVTRGIYEQFGLDWTPEAEVAITAIDREAREGKAAPSHRYSLDDYGLTEAQVREAFDR